MGSKKKKAGNKRRQEEAQESEVRRGSHFFNITNGIIFILTGIVCIICLVVILIYADNSAGKYINMIFLALMAVFFFYKSPYYLRNRKQK